MGKRKSTTTATEAVASNQTKKPNSSGRSIKGEIKFQITLNEEQKTAKSTILQNQINVLIGKAGSGKTILGAQIALDMFFRKVFDKIIITRPMVTANEETGFLPGDLNQKMDPYLQAIYQNLYQCYNKEKINSMLKDDDIEILPIAYMRGRTAMKAILLVDEAQNITTEQMKMVITRLGKGSKIIFTGDMAQCDLKNPSRSGLAYLLEAGKDVDGFEIIELKTNHRDPLVDVFLDKFNELDNRLEEEKLLKYQNRRNGKTTHALEEITN